MEAEGRAWRVRITLDEVEVEEVYEAKVVEEKSLQSTGHAPSRRVHCRKDAVHGGRSTD